MVHSYHIKFLQTGLKHKVKVDLRLAPPPTEPEYSSVEFGKAELRHGNTLKPLRMRDARAIYGV